MKLDARRVADFLRDPGDCRAVLLHGEDGGLVRERAEALLRAVAGSLHDPFRVAELDRDGFSRIPEEVSARSLVGGRRVVRVREAGDAAAVPVAAALSGEPEALLVLEAGELPPRSRLRAALERSAHAVVIGCYREEGGALRQFIQAELRRETVSIDPDATAWVAEQLGADRAATRSEIEKLALYAGPGGVVSLEVAAAVGGDVASLQLEDALFAATAADVAATDRALGRVLAEGASPVSIVRSALFHLQRLVRARAAMAGGLAAAEAARAVRPPLFFRRIASFGAALNAWPLADLAEACRAMWETELACKQTGAPAELLCREAILSLAHRAGRGRRS
ncbi:MAG: DNA polymerase III subunit delta [Acidisphaera sp.]|nr:DNA polymerase III subunit delta [Acidisphaera sp.]